MRKLIEIKSLCYEYNSEKDNIEVIIHRTSQDDFKYFECHLLWYLNNYTDLGKKYKVSNIYFHQLDYANILDIDIYLNDNQIKIDYIQFNLNNLLHELDIHTPFYVTEEYADKIILMLKTKGELDI